MDEIPPNYYGTNSVGGTGETSSSGGTTYETYCLFYNWWENGTLISTEVIPGSCWQTAVQTT